MQCAGPEAARTISERGANVVLTGRVGPNAKAALDAVGIKIIEGVQDSVTVKDAVEAFKAGGEDGTDFKTPLPCTLPKAVPGVTRAVLLSKRAKCGPGPIKPPNASGSVGGD